MNDAKYIGMDVHQATTSAAVRDSSGNLVMEATLETKTETIHEFVHRPLTCLCGPIVFPTHVNPERQ
jgi:hypothetical protein